MRGARETAGLAQEAIADRISARLGYRIRQARVSAWESDTNSPTPETVELWAEICHVKPGWLTHGEKGGAEVPEWWASWRAAYAHRERLSEPRRPGSGRKRREG